MMMIITKVQAQALAQLIATIRPNWDPTGTLAAILKTKDAHDTTEICHALLRLATDPKINTPALLSYAGNHWIEPTQASLNRRPGESVGPDHCPKHGYTATRHDHIHVCCATASDCIICPDCETRLYDEATA